MIANFVANFREHVFLDLRRMGEEDRAVGGEAAL
jgi:hypothetical protein